MGNMANIKEFFDCCSCTHRDLKASKHFDENKNDIENIENGEQNDSSFTDAEFPTMKELEEFNKKFDKKFEKYNQIPKSSNILYISGIIE